MISTPSSFFENSKDLRQGDPLTLYLLVLAMEVWNRLLERAREGGYLSSFTVKGKGGEVVEMSHLLFVDDTLIFCEDSQD